MNDLEVRKDQYFIRGGIVRLSDDIIHVGYMIFCRQGIFYISKKSSLDKQILQAGENLANSITPHDVLSGRKTEVNADWIQSNFNEICKTDAELLSNESINLQKKLWAVQPINMQKFSSINISFFPRTETTLEISEEDKKNFTLRFRFKDTLNVFRMQTTTLNSLTYNKGLIKITDYFESETFFEENQLPDTWGYGYTIPGPYELLKTIKEYNYSNTLTESSYDDTYLQQFVWILDSLSIDEKESVKDNLDNLPDLFVHKVHKMLTKDLTFSRNLSIAFILITILGIASWFYGSENRMHLLKVSSVVISILTGLGSYGLISSLLNERTKIKMFKREDGHLEGISSKKSGGLIKAFITIVILAALVLGGIKGWEIYKENQLVITPTLINDVAHQFKDERNGFFQCDYPSSWQSKLYDDNRTKITFYHGSNPDLFLRVIAKKSNKNFPEVWSEATKTVEKMEQKNVNCSIDTMDVMGSIKAAHVLSDLSNYNAGYTELILFVANGIHFNIQLCGSNKQEIKDSQDKFELIINSIKVLE